MSDLHFEVHSDTEGRWHWRLVDDSGQSHAASPPEGFLYQHAAIRSIEIVKQAAPSAWIDA